MMGIPSLLSYRFWGVMSTRDAGRPVASAKGMSGRSWMLVTPEKICTFCTNSS